MTRFCFALTILFVFASCRQRTEEAGLRDIKFDQQTTYKAMSFPNLKGSYIVRCGDLNRGWDHCRDYGDMLLIPRDSLNSILTSQAAKAKAFSANKDSTKVI